jgi:hypothetical protein
MIMTMRVTYELWNLHLGIHRRGPGNIHIGGVTFCEELGAVGLDALVIGVEVAAVATPEVGVPVGVGNLVGCYVSSNLQKQWCMLDCELRWSWQQAAAEFNNTQEANPKVEQLLHLCKWAASLKAVARRQLLPFFFLFPPVR